MKATTYPHNNRVWAFGANQQNEMLGRLDRLERGREMRRE